MKINIDTNNFTYEVEELIGNIPKILEKKERTYLKKCGEIVEKNVLSELPESDPKQFQKNYDGTKPYVHMKNDVEVKVRKSYGGTLYAKVMGGKNTGYKWRFLNDGTMDEKGQEHVIPTHFMENAFKKSESEIASETDKLLMEVVNSEL